MGVSPRENFEIFEIAVGDFLVKNLCLLFFLTLLIMSVGLLGRGVKTETPQHAIKSFLGVEILNRGFNPPTSPSNTALVVGPWEWGDPRDGRPWEWGDPGDGDPGNGGPIPSTSCSFL